MIKTIVTVSLGLLIFSVPAMAEKPGLKSPAKKPAKKAAAGKADKKAGKAASAEVVKSTAPPLKKVTDIFNRKRRRDIFVPVGSGYGSEDEEVYDPDTVDVDALLRRILLKGIMREKSGIFAVLVDPSNGTGFILRKGKLYDYRHNRIRGVRGKINLLDKEVTLRTPEKHIQILRLGEEEEEEEE